MGARTLRRRFTVSLTAAVFACLAMVPAAGADVDTFTVDVLTDDGDIMANNLCEDGGGDCTLRAALQEANDGDAATDTDVINFAAGVVDSTIPLGSVLPSIDEPTVVNGCSSDLNNAGPCVGVQGASTATDAFFVTGGGTDVTIRGLAITKSNRAIVALDGTENLTVKNCWFGIKIDGATGEANNYGVELTDDTAVIGGTAGATGASPADRNVFANNSVAGVSVFNGDNTQVLGNYFGTNVAGSAAAANGTNIQFDGNGSDPPTDPVIGGAQPTPGTCTGPCNVISGATSNGINLKVTTEDAIGAVIQGNFIGLNAAGTAALGNTTGIRVVNAPNTTIGGSVAGEPNFITGGSTAISALFQGAPGLEVTNNLIGTNTAGTAALTPPSLFGMLVTSDQTDPAAITDNTIATNTVTGNDAIQAAGDGATISDNLIGVGPAGQDLGLGSTGIRTVKLDSATITNNTIGNFSLSGITLEGDTGTAVTDNLIGTDADGNNHGGGTRGVQVTNNGITPSTGNTIGGNLAADENVISNLAGDAIEVINDLDSASNTTENVNNVIARNRGANNGSGANDLFIDLKDDILDVGDGPGNPATGPNDAVQAPAVTLAGANNAGGTAMAGSTVRVFSKATASPGEVQGFLGSATTAGNGTWALAYAAPVADGTRVVATQTDGSNTSELSAFEVTDGLAPATQIDSGPSGPTSDTTPTFAFSGEVGATLECRLDAAAFAPCTSPVTTAALADGAHTFQARATDADLNVDATPASRSFEVDTVAPQTTITSGPKPSSRLQPGKRKKKVTLAFTSSEPGEGGFQCQMDSQPFVLCTSPFVRKLKRGKHTFRVRAFDGAANPDPSLATRTFRIKRPRPR